MSDPPARRFHGRDGVELAYREIGEGRPLVLLHGLIESGLTPLDQGPARALAAGGRLIVLPDLRGHGASARPHDAAAYPPDVLADDGLALIEELGLDDYDLGGYSLGARIVLRMLVRGARPAGAIVGGQGIDALDGATGRTGGHRRVLTALAEGTPIDPGSRDAQRVRWIVRSGADPRALLHVLGTLVATPPAALRAVPTPTLVVTGEEDERPSPGELASLLPNGRLTRVPGTHFTAPSDPAFAAAVLDFLDRRP